MSAVATSWHASGLMFENCSCQIVCPGHMHFSQACTHERCIGHWAIRVDHGDYGDVSLAGTRALVAFDCPQHMIQGNWTEIVIIDEAASPGQRAALETILTGGAGGSWALLARFVSRRLETRFLPLTFTDEGATKRATIPGVLDASVTNIKGRDRSKPVTFENIFNQIHGATQVLALGSTTYDDGVIRIATDRTHGLHSRFEWTVG
ncbi:MAG TPA: DUF1326 domain-containing protein [Vicinamibacterales bacterium]|nr:DUF1326 domain-containing protein [Vicinamibacterales bacterium]